MADIVVTDPLVLDETLRTTDGNNTNLADLMQSGLLNIANALGNLPSYSAGNITYDNSTSGLAATDVKDALDELASEKADASSVYTKAQTDAKIEALDYSDTAVNGSYVKAVSETDGVIAVTREAADATPTENSQKLVTSGGVYAEIDALNDALTHKMSYADNGILGAKNLIPLSLRNIKSILDSQTWVDNICTMNDIDFTVNMDADGNVTSISADGTALYDTYFRFARLTVSEGISYTLTASTGGSNSTYMMRAIVRDSNGTAISIGGTVFQNAYGGTDITITMPTSSVYVDVYIVVMSTVNVSETFYPMFRLANDTDSTFRPYAKTNLELTNDIYGKMSYSDNGILGAKNLLPMVLSDIKSFNTGGTWSDNIYSYRGIDFTINTDSNGNIVSIGANGTASQSLTFWFVGNEYSYAKSSKGLLNAGDYLLNGGISDDARLQITSYNSDGTEFMSVVQTNGTNAKLFTIPSSVSSDTGWLIYIIINSGEVIDNDVFYPMIRLATDTDDTFQPYAKTNLQLTNDVASLNTDLAQMYPESMSVETLATYTLSDTTTYSYSITVPYTGYVGFEYSTVDTPLDLFARIRFANRVGFSSRCTYPAYYSSEPMLYLPVHANTTIYINYKKISGSDSATLKVILAH